MFIWKEEFSVNIPLIDEQHKKLFKIGNNINELLKNYYGQDSFDQILAEVSKLVEYTKYHFSQEEKLMEHYNYDELEKHIAEHNKFILYLEGLDYEVINFKQKEALTDLVKFIASWIFKHIMNTDFRYSEFLINAMD